MSTPADLSLPSADFTQARFEDAQNHYAKNSIPPKLTEAQSQKIHKVVESRIYGSVDLTNISPISSSKK